MKVETNIIASITESLIRQTMILAIIYIKTFNTNVRILMDNISIYA